MKTFIQKQEKRILVLFFYCILNIVFSVFLSAAFVLHLKSNFKQHCALSVSIASGWFYDSWTKCPQRVKRGLQPSLELVNRGAVTHFEHLDVVHSWRSTYEWTIYWDAHNVLFLWLLHRGWAVDLQSGLLFARNCSIPIQQFYLALQGCENRKRINNSFCNM